MKRTKKHLSFLLAVCLVVTACLTPAGAVEDTAEGYLQWIEELVEETESGKRRPSDEDAFLGGVAKTLPKLERAIREEGTIPDGIEGILERAEAQAAVRDGTGSAKAKAAIQAFREAMGIGAGEIEVSGGSAPLVTGFDDVPENHWAYRYIMAIVNAGAVEGTRAPVGGIGHFDPEVNVTLGQFLAAAVRLVAPERVQKQEGEAHWAMPYYRVAREEGWIWFSETWNDVTEQLDSRMSRDMLAYYLVGAAQTKGELLRYSPAVAPPDLSVCSNPRAVSMCYYSGLLQGDNSGRFNPSSSLTRQELATVLCRLMGYVERTEVELPAGAEEFTPHANYYKSISEDGYTVDDPDHPSNGRLVTDYARQYDYETLNMTRVGVDGKGIYLSVTAPQLPAEIADRFHIRVWSHPYRENFDEFANTIDMTLKPGESQTLYFETWFGAPVARGDVGQMSVAVSVDNEQGRRILSHRINWNNPAAAYESWEVSGDGLWVDFDASAVWAGLG